MIKFSLRRGDYAGGRILSRDLVEEMDGEQKRDSVTWPLGWQFGYFRPYMAEPLGK